MTGGKRGEWRADARRDRREDRRPRLEALSAGKGRQGDPFTLRWVIGHLIEETSRHNGHLDIVRELVDGVKGG